MSTLLNTEFTRRMALGAGGSAIAMASVAIGGQMTNLPANAQPVLLLDERAKSVLDKADFPGRSTSRRIEFDTDVVFAWYEKLRPAMRNERPFVLGVTDAQTEFFCRELASDYGYTVSDSTLAIEAFDTHPQFSCWFLKPSDVRNA